MTDTAWIDAALTSARPQAVGALLRYFRNLDTAEEAFQNACLRALKSWPQNGPPRDPAAWLIMVGRNAAIDEVRRSHKQEPLPDDAAISDLDDAEEELADRLDGSHYRDDILRLLFICCHPDLPATQQIALALRIVSGLTVKQIARAFLVCEAGDGAAHHPRQGARRQCRRAVRDAGRGRAQRAARGRRGDDLSDLQRRLFGQRRDLRNPQAAVRGGDPAGAAVAPAVPERARDHGAHSFVAAATRPRGRALRCRAANWCCSTTRTARCGIRS